MTEDDTRAELIEPKLRASGWETNPSKSIRVLRNFAINDGEIQVGGKRGRALRADFVLEYNNTILAVIEAKRKEIHVASGISQAKEYARLLDLRTSFATNGLNIWQIDHKTGYECEVESFPTPEELWERTFGECSKWYQKFCSIPFENFNGSRPPRYYQRVAVNRAVEAIANKRKRLLLTLATGTGKTFIAFQIAWKLFKTRWTLQRDGNRLPRILFLADRNILADQAFQSFSAFDDDALVRLRPSEISMTGSVFFTIFQTFMSGNNPNFFQFEPDFFDLVIIDECHRGGANDESSWRNILEHFSPAVHLGLTATPKRDANINTYEYFGEPVFTYSLKQGTQDGFLTPFKVKRIRSNIDEYKFQEGDEVVEGEIEESRIYTEKDFNKEIYIPEREEERVMMMLENIVPEEKTIVFCRSQLHAGLVRDLINQKSEQTNVDYCVRVTADEGLRGEVFLKQFRDNEKNIPTILTTSRKLSTGVDARNVRNIVLMRPINTMVEFKQIIGRGTRLYDGKHYFTIVDFVGASDKFNDPEWDGDPMEKIIQTEEEMDSNNVTELDQKMVLIKLSDNRVRELHSVVSTSIYYNGKTITLGEFLEHLYKQLKPPVFFDSEDKLRELWSHPMTRVELLKKINSAGCKQEDLDKLCEMIPAKDSDLIDVLQFIAFAKRPITREKRVNKNRDKILNMVNQEQKEFVEFVLKNYIEEGINELGHDGLSTVLKSKYGALEVAKYRLGSMEEIKDTFYGFQKHLYSEAA